MHAARIALVLLVAVATVVAVALFARGAVQIVRTIRLGAPAAGRWRPVTTRLATLLREALSHQRFAGKPGVREAHWFVMVSFVVLVLTLAQAYGQVADPTFVLPVVGHWQPLEWLTEAFAWLGLAGIALLMVVRQRVRPRAGASAGEQRSSRFFGSNNGAAVFVELTVLLVVLAVIVLRSLEYAQAAADPATAHLASAGHFPLTGWIAGVWSGLDLGAIGWWITAVALVKIAVSLSWFVVVGLQPTMGVAWHRFLAIVNIYARREPAGGVALGPAAPLLVDGQPFSTAVMETMAEDTTLGVATVADLTWKQLLDVASCTECGRCQAQCPAWATGKPLSPKLVVTTLRDQAAAEAPYLRAARAAALAGAAAGAASGAADGAGATAGGPAGRTPAGSAADHGLAGGHVDVDLVGSGLIDPDALWACTMCGACVEQCPVDIEHVDTILDLRRYRVLMAGEMPPELATTLTKIERQGNPWGLPARKRLAWADGLDFAVPVIGTDVEDAAALDYLFWVGCAGAYEDKAMATTRAVAELLHAAGVTFGVLAAESCTGDPARRAGNEVLFTMLAEANVEALDAAKAQRIVVTCAHCFNTLAREYPGLGGRYEVVHHTELLAHLVREGRLVPVTDPGAERTAEPGAETATGADAQAATAAPLTVTYHDPCFLGRHNSIYTPARELLAALPGVQLTEMPRRKETAMCCGAGGARMWMEESIGTRISTTRAAEAIGTGAEQIVTACPFCSVMLGDGAAAAGSAASKAAGVAGGSPASVTQVGIPEVADIAVLLRGRLAAPAAPGE